MTCSKIHRQARAGALDAKAPRAKKTLATQRSQAQNPDLWPIQHNNIVYLVSEETKMN